MNYFHYLFIFFKNCLYYSIDRLAPTKILWIRVNVPCNSRMRFPQGMICPDTCNIFVHLLALFRCMAVGFESAIFVLHRFSVDFAKIKSVVNLLHFFKISFLFCKKILFFTLSAVHGNVSLTFVYRRKNTLRIAFANYS